MNAAYLPLPSRSGSLGREILEDEPKPFYSLYADSYRHWIYPPAIRQFQQAEKEFLIKNVEAGSKVIDIGCGPGEHIVGILGNGRDITAVDFVPEMIEIAKSRVGDKVHFICDDVMRLSFQRDSFDFGICYCTLPNQLAYRSFFNQISSFCKRLIVSIYDWQARNEVVDFYRVNGLHAHLNEDEKAVVLDEGLRYLFVPEDVVMAMFDENGFDLTVARQPFGNIYFGVKRTSS